MAVADELGDDTLHTHLYQSSDKANYEGYVRLN